MAGDLEEIESSSAATRDGLNEVLALASLSLLDVNDHVVRYYTSWYEEGQLYIRVLIPFKIKPMESYEGD